MCLDAQSDAGSIEGDQLDYFNAVMDTLENVTHFILVHHKLIWMSGHPVLDSQINAISNGVMLYPQKYVYFC